MDALHETQPRTGDERGQALHELERRHHDMGGTVVVGTFELQHDLTDWIPFKPLVTGNVSAQVLRPRRAKQGNPWPWLSSPFR